MSGYNVKDVNSGTTPRAHVSKATDSKSSTMRPLSVGYVHGKLLP